MFHSRRSILRYCGSLFGVIAITGCSTPFGTSRGATDIEIKNMTEQSLQVAVEVIMQDSDDSLVDESVSVEAGETKTINNKIMMGTACEVSVAVDGGPSDTYQWDDPSHPLLAQLTKDTVNFKILTSK